MTTVPEDVRRICLPPFRHLLDRLPALRVTDFYEDPFEPYLHQQTATKSWDLDHFTALALRREGPVLDIGCGRGRVALALAAKGLSVTAVDTSRAAITRLRTHLEQHPQPATRVRVVHGDILNPRTPTGSGYATAVLGDTAVNMFVDEEALTGFLARVRSLLACDGVFGLPVLSETALSTYARRNGLLATDFVDDGGSRHLLFAAMRYATEGPYFSRTLFTPDTIRDDEGEPVAHLAAVRERLWTHDTLVPHVHAAGLRVTERLKAVPRDDSLGRVDAEILVLTHQVSEATNDR
ncbi:class I SAM-dependent methyltransferase [Streptomyces sp. NPDC088254]|uniref:class I SAM-dependent methyltransferase n=1 Tax=Streptomyces sp. NPDC088254 TaxID=3365847 RepID=UPI0038206BF3